MSAFRDITLEVQGPVVWITIARPDVRNSLAIETTEEIRKALRDVAEDDAIRAVALTGAGNVFCSGARLGGDEGKPAARRAKIHGIGAVYTALVQCPLPTIAAVNGYALAGGCGLAAFCDFVIAAPEARFGVPEINFGGVPAMVMVALLRLVGPQKTLEFAVSGEQISAEDARAMGLVTRVTAPGMLRAEVQTFGEALATKSKPALWATKDLLYRLGDLPLPQAIAYAADHHFYNYYGWQPRGSGKYWKPADKEQG